MILACVRCKIIVANVFYSYYYHNFLCFSKQKEKVLINTVNK